MKTAFYISGRANVFRQIIKRSPKDLLNNIAFVFSEDDTTNDIEDLLAETGGG